MTKNDSNIVCQAKGFVLGTDIGYEESMRHDLSDWYVDNIVIPYYHKINTTIWTPAEKEIGEFRFRNLLLIINNHIYAQERILEKLKEHHLVCSDCGDYYI